MTVYVTQRPVPDSSGWQPDLTPADKYGPVDFIFEGHERVFALPVPSLHKARRRLRDFDPEKDFLLHPNSFDQIALACCIVALTEQKVQCINMLYFDRVKNDDGSRNRRVGTYYPVRLELRPEKVSVNP